jgi:hypothetical protein
MTSARHVLYRDIRVPLQRSCGHSDFAYCEKLVRTLFEQPEIHGSVRHIHMNYASGMSDLNRDALKDASASIAARNNYLRETSWIEDGTLKCLLLAYHFFPIS